MSDFLVSVGIGVESIVFIEKFHCLFYPTFNLPLLNTAWVVIRLVMKEESFVNCPSFFLKLSNFWVIGRLTNIFAFLYGSVEG